ncbi:MAG TPA: OmpA family protein [Chitinophagales bacterium]|nr:OmpA family protein [Chitinophagales bacterium]HPA35733.1 OmpA family protein [Chitinophagales bacterium]HQO32599.1 OmpA family protein [Chitinophagales bacterium]HQO90238.1 OmpA family protein [Chitinophagales bacterium]
MHIRQILTVFMLLLSGVAMAGSKYSILNNALVLPEDIQFEQHAYDVKNPDDPMLDLVAQYLMERPDITKLRIEGHVYTEKTPEQNMKLSLQRAAMISYYLTTKGVDCSRLLPVAFGDTRPVAPTDECNLHVNTRIDFYNAELNRMLLGMSADGYALKIYNPCEE